MLRGPAGCHPGTPAHPPSGPGRCRCHPHAGRAPSERLRSRADIPPARPFCCEPLPRAVWGRAFISAAGARGAKPRHSPAASAASARPCCACLPSSVMFLERFWVQIFQMWLTGCAWSLLGHCSRWGQSLSAQGGWRRQPGSVACRSSLCSALLPRRFPGLSSSLKSKHQTQRQPLPGAQPARCPAAATSSRSLRCAVPLRSGAAAPRCRGLLLQPPVLSRLPGRGRAALCWSRKAT